MRAAPPRSACRSPRTRPRRTRGDPRCGDPWLGFSIPAYRVSRALRDGDRVGPLQVVHTPGQTPGHVAYWHASERVAITGDLLQDGDVAWVPFGGPWASGALERTVASLRRIAALDPVRSIPGHGPVVTDVPAAVAANLERYARFAEDPSRAVWHAARRATVSHLMIAPRTAASLAALPWVPMAAAAVDLSPLDVRVARSSTAWASAAWSCATARCSTPPSRTNRGSAGITTRSRDSCRVASRGRRRQRERQRLRVRPGPQRVVRVDALAERDRRARRSTPAGPARRRSGARRRLRRDAGLQRLRQRERCRCQRPVAGLGSATSAPRHRRC